MKPKYKNFASLLSSSAIIQFLPVLIIPILSRLIQPSEYGYFASLSAIITIICIFSSGKFEILFTSYKSKNIKIVIIMVSMIFAITFAFFGFVISHIYLVLSIENFNALHLNSLLISFLVGTIIFLYTMNQVMVGYMTSIGLFHKLSLSRLIGGICIPMSQLFFCIINPSFISLLLGTATGYFISLSYQLVTIPLKTPFLLISKSASSRGYVLLKNYWVKNVNAVIADSVSTSLSQAPVLYLTANFGPSLAGMYAMTQRTLLAPMRLIAVSISPLFRKDFSDAFLDNLKLSKIFWSYTFGLTIISTLIYLTVMLFGETLYFYFLGSSWLESASFASAVIMLYCLKFIVSPTSFLIFIIGKYKFNALIHIFLLVAMVFVFWYFEFNNPFIAVSMFSYIYSLFYVIFFTFLVIFVRKAEFK